MYEIPTRINAQIIGFVRLLREKLGADVVTPYTQGIKLLEEVDELNLEIREGNDQEAIGELVDSVIVLFVMANTMGVSVETVLDRVQTKMNVNLARQWSISSTGAAHHDKEN